MAIFSVSHEHQEQGAKARNIDFASLSNTAIGVHGQRKIVICGLSRYNQGLNIRQDLRDNQDIFCLSGGLRFLAFIRKLRNQQ
jgi:hypothetical protein